jgi:Leucine-rich repeat (LRR) protein
MKQKISTSKSVKKEFMSEKLRIGGKEYELSKKTTISVIDGCIDFQLVAEIEDPANSKIGDFVRISEVGFRCYGITFPTTLPERTIIFPDDPSEDVSIWLDGFQMDTVFSGFITFHKGWLHLQGKITIDWIPRRFVKIELWKQYGPQTVDPRHWVFRNLEEIQKWGSSNVHQGNIEVVGDRIPDIIGTCINLEKLTLNLLMGRIPSGFQALHALRILHLRGDNCSKLPAEVYQLCNLNSLSVKVGIKDLSPQIKEMTGLNNLDLSSNNLESIPDEVGSLKNLTSLNLGDNLLKKLPESIGTLPMLEYLDLERNAFQALPESLQHIRRVDIEHRFKKLYMDTRYHSNNPQPINPLLYNLSGTPDLQWAVDAGIQKHGLQSYKAAIDAEARIALQIIIGDPSRGNETGNSRIGGSPDLPSGIGYPKTEDQHWTFLAQIDLDEIAVLQDFMPRHGLLAFFCEDTLHGLESESPMRGNVRVFHFQKDHLCRYTFPDDARFVQEDLAGKGYPEFMASAKRVVSLPYLYSDKNRLSTEGKKLLELKKTTSSPSTKVSEKSYIRPVTMANTTISTDMSFLRMNLPKKSPQKPLAENIMTGWCSCLLLTIVNWDLCLETREP